MADQAQEHVNHPTHYNQGVFPETIELMRRSFGDEEVKIFCKLNAFKYRMRAGDKKPDPTIDIDKAKWYEAYYLKLSGQQSDPKATFRAAQIENEGNDPAQPTVEPTPAPTPVSAPPKESITVGKTYPAPDAEVGEVIWSPKTIIRNQILAGIEPEDPQLQEIRKDIDTLEGLLKLMQRQHRDRLSEIKGSHKPLPVELQFHKQLREHSDRISEKIRTDRQENKPDFNRKGNDAP